MNSISAITASMRSMTINVQPVEESLEFRRQFLSRDLPASYRSLIHKPIFWDKAESHTFSDWLMSSALSVGVEAMDEFYLGGLPDLSEVLKRDGKWVTVHANALSLAKSQHLTRLGKILKKKSPGATWMDLGCGLPELSVVPRLLAQIFGAQGYVGVDSHHISRDEIRENEFPELGPFQSYFLNDDVLNFLGRLEFPAPKIFVMAGLEPEKPHLASSKQMLACIRTEILRLLERDDLIVFGAGAPELEMPKKDFKEIYSDFYHSVFERRRSFWKLPSFISGE